MTDTGSLEPFTIPTDAVALADLQRRLRATRWPDATGVDGWELGADIAYLRDLVDYWADDFDWPARVAELNALPHHRIEVGGLGVHVIHARGRAHDGRPPVPLLLCHGWPDSFWRYLKVIPLLTDPGAHGGDPADAFDVIVPDMPGYGYSQAPATPIDSAAVAGLWAELMTTLGHDRFLVAGGDIGSGVARFLALDHPDRVVAVHRMDAGLPAISPDDPILTEPEREWLQKVAAWGATEGAYAAMHRTKPQTAGVGLTDSPAGLAAWIVEKLRSWSDCGGEIESVYSKDDILTLVTQYWMTGTIASSMRMYSANGHLTREQLLRRVEVPSGFSLYASDLSEPPQEWLERSANPVWVRRHERGGHFAPYERPAAYAADLREFFRPYREGV